MTSGEVPLRIFQRGNGQAPDISGGGVSRDGGTDANTARTAENSETSPGAPDASHMAGEEGLASDANSSTISMGIRNGAADKDRIDGKGEVQERPAPVQCCYDQIYIPHSFRWGKCSRKAGHGPGLRYCKQHDPAAVKARHKARQERHEAQSAKWQAQWAYDAEKKQWLAGCITAIEQIAAGHNDPRGLACDLVASRPEAKP